MGCRVTVGFLVLCAPLGCGHSPRSFGTLSDAGSPTAGASGESATGATSGAGGLGASGGSSSGGAGASGGSGAGPLGEAGQAGEAGSAGPLVLRTLSLLAGQLGGIGSADGLKANARLGYGSLPVWDSVAKSLYLYDGGLRGVGITNGSISTLYRPTSTTTSPLALTLPPYLGSVGMAMSDNTIRSTNMATGVETIIAGAPFMGGSTDGAATDARFNFANGAGIAYDSGTWFVCDAGNDTIRKISGGTVSTLVGKVGVAGHADGDSISATFSSPSAMVLASPYLYVADTGNFTIRRVDEAGNTITVAGSPGVRGNTDGKTGLLAGPRALAIKASTLFVMDGEAVRSLDLSGNLGLVTLAGATGEPGLVDGPAASARFGFSGGLASDGADKVFVSDAAVLRMLTLSTATVTTVVGAPEHFGSDDGAATAASFNKPAGVAADAAGHVFVADSSNGTIRSINVAQGMVSTLAGWPGLVGEVDGIGTDARFALPASSAYASAGLVTDTDDHLFVADSFGSTIRRVVVSTASVTTLAGLSHAQAEVDATGVDARFDVPSGITRAGDKLYITDDFASTVRELDPDGQVKTVWRNAGAADSGADPPLRFGCVANYLAVFIGIAADGAGNLYISDCGNHAIRKLVIDTGELSVLAGSIGNPGTDDGIGDAARFETPLGIAFDGNGNLYVADGQASTLRKIVIGTLEVTTIAGTPNRRGISLGPLPGSLNTPNGVAVLPDGSVAVSDAAEHSILLLH